MTEAATRRTAVWYRSDPLSEGQAQTTVFFHPDLRASGENNTGLLRTFLLDAIGPDSPSPIPFYVIPRDGAIVGISAGPLADSSPRAVRLMAERLVALVADWSGRRPADFLIRPTWPVDCAVTIEPPNRHGSGQWRLTLALDAVLGPKPELLDSVHRMTGLDDPWQVAIGALLGDIARRVCTAQISPVDWPVPQLALLGTGTAARRFVQGLTLTVNFTGVGEFHWAPAARAAVAALTEWTGAEPGNIRIREVLPAAA